jgi:hypothetical protein
VALDKLSEGGQSSSRSASIPKVKPVVPALAIQSEYGFHVPPYWMNHGSSLAPRPASPSERPDPRREQKTGFDAWRKAGVDSNAHRAQSLDPPGVHRHPAGHAGQPLRPGPVGRVRASLARQYLKHRRQRRTALLSRRFRYLEPVGVGRWAPVRLERASQLSFYYCSGYRLRGQGRGRPLARSDLSGVGGC